MNSTESFDMEKFYLGTLCKRGHEYKNSGMSFRYKKGNYCVLCSKINEKKYRKENREKILDYQKKYYQGNREKWQIWGEKRHKENREQILEYQKKRYRENREKYRTKAAKHYQENREQILEYQKKRYQENHEKYSDLRKEKIKKLETPYVKQMLVKQLGIQSPQITPEIIALKREQLKIHRNAETLRKELENGTD